VEVLGQLGIDPDDRGAVFGTVLTGVTFPDSPDRIDKDTLLVLNALFAGGVVVAPFLFQALRDWRVDPIHNELSGFILTLLLAMGVTLGAVIGEIYALGLLANALTTTDAQDTAVLWTRDGLAVLSIVYFLGTAWWTANTDWAEEARKKKEAEPAPKPPAPPHPVDVDDISKLGIVPPALEGMKLEGVDKTVALPERVAGSELRPFYLDVDDVSKIAIVAAAPAVAPVGDVDRLVILPQPEVAAGAAPPGAPLRWTLP
jgi:hypothetical protein